MVGLVSFAYKIVEAELISLAFPPAHSNLTKIAVFSEL